MFLCFNLRKTKLHNYLKRNCNKTLIPAFLWLIPRKFIKKHFCFNILETNYEEITGRNYFLLNFLGFKGRYLKGYFNELGY